MKSTIKLLASMLAAAILSAACQTVQTTQAGAVGVERRQSMLVSSEEVEQASAKAYQDVLQQAKAKGALNRDAAQTERVRRIAQRLIPQTRVFRPDAPGWKWEVNVIASDELNAWCMAGGKIAFYSGLVDKLGLNDGEIAAVMGHEISHALREHSREQASRAVAASLGVSVVGALVGLNQLGVDLASTITDITFNRPNSRLAETEADRMGVELAARAGYDPRAALTLWQKMQKQSSGQPPQWLSTHPSHDTRIQDLEMSIQRVMPLYQARN